MKRSHLIFVLPLVCLAGCATLNKGDRYFLQEHQISPTLYAKMLHEEPLLLADIIELSQRHLPPGFILHYLSSSYVVYRLNSQDVIHLRQEKVSPQVVDYLLQTPAMYGPEINSGYFRSPFDPFYDYPGGPFVPRECHHRR